MNNIKEELKDLVEELVIPEVEAYLDDLHKLLEENKQSEEDLEIIKEMESFLVELHNILAVIEEDSITTEEYERVYKQLMKHVKEHKE